MPKRMCGGAVNLKIFNNNKIYKVIFENVLKTYESTDAYRALGLNRTRQ